MRTPFRRRLRLTLFFSSFALFPWSLNWLSPYLSVAGAWAGVVSGSVLVFATLALTAPVLGRSFCSWLCPGGFVGEALAAFRPGVRGGPRLGRVKWLVWAPWLLALVSGWVVAGVRALDPTWSPGPAGADDWLRSVGAGTVMTTLVTALLAALALAFGRRGACHTVCWMAPFLVLGRGVGRRWGIPGLRLEAQPSACVTCGACDAACPMGLAIGARVRSGRPEDPDCILCADCVDTCPQRAIGLGFGR